MKILKFIVTIIVFTYSYTICDKVTPQITVIFVVDQFAYHYIPKLNPYFRYGLKKLLDEGVVYTQAHCPHGMPSTATGHAGLNTGTYAKDHGAVGNSLFSAVGKKIPIDFDSAQNAAVFSPSGSYDFGRSAANLMVDGLSDQFVLSGNNNYKSSAYSISLKSRAAILTAGKLGKPVWFDEKAGQFTSSKAFFSELPSWLINFNNQFNAIKPVLLHWPLMYEATNPAYSMTQQINDLSENKFINKKHMIPQLPNHAAYTKFMQLPHTHQLLFELAKKIVIDHAAQENKNRLLLWVCLSSLDKLGHELGPDNIATIDMIYYLDKQLGIFLEFLDKSYGSKVLSVLTSDHGISPLIETMQQKGYKSAQRYSSKEFIQFCNDAIAKQFGYSSLILAYKTPSLFLNQEVLNPLDQKTYQKIMSVLLEILHAHPAVKKAWISEELKRLPFQPTDVENFFKQQLYHGRSGQMTIQTFPYTIITTYPVGISHKTPYDYDTHVPIILHRKQMIGNKHITQKVWTLQLANSLSDLLGINRPSASVFEPLPGIDYTTGLSTSMPKSLIKGFSDGALPKNSSNNNAGSLLPPGANTMSR